MVSARSRQHLVVLLSRVVLSMGPPSPNIRQSLPENVGDLNSKGKCSVSLVEVQQNDPSYHSVDLHDCLFL